MGPTWGPSGADRTQVGPMLAPWTLLSGSFLVYKYLQKFCTKHDSLTTIYLIWINSTYPSISNTFIYIYDINEGVQFYKCLGCVQHKCIFCQIRSRCPAWQLINKYQMTAFKCQLLMKCCYKSANKGVHLTHFNGMSVSVNGRHVLVLVTLIHTCLFKVHFDWDNFNDIKVKGQSHRGQNPI